MREVLLLCWRDTGHPQGGGSERYLEQVGAGLAERGIKVTLRTATYPGRPARGGRRRRPDQPRRWTAERVPPALGAIAAGRLGSRTARTDAPRRGGRHPERHPLLLESVVSARRSRVLVHHCHREQWPVAGELMAGSAGGSSRGCRRACTGDSQYLTVSLPSADELVDLGVERERIAVVRNGADALPVGVDAGERITRTAHPTVCVLSRLVPHKQIEDALDAVAALRLTHSRTASRRHRRWLVGAEPARTRRTSWVSTTPSRSTGTCAEERKHELLARSWVHLMPSRKEGWGLAVIEAAQHGVPTVGYRSSKGLTDSIVDGVTGLLVGGSADDDATDRRRCSRGDRRTLLLDARTPRRARREGTAAGGRVLLGQTGPGWTRYCRVSRRAARVRAGRAARESEHGSRRRASDGSRARRPRAAPPTADARPMTPFGRRSPASGRNLARYPVQREFVVLQSPVPARRACAASRRAGPGWCVRPAPSRPEPRQLVGRRRPPAAAARPGWPARLHRRPPPPATTSWPVCSTSARQDARRRIEHRRVAAVGERAGTSRPAAPRRRRLVRLEMSRPPAARTPGYCTGCSAPPTPHTRSGSATHDRDDRGDRDRTRGSGAGCPAPAPAAAAAARRTARPARPTSGCRAAARRPARARPPTRRRSSPHGVAPARRASTADGGQDARARRSPGCASPPQRGQHRAHDREQQKLSRPPRTE